MKAYLRGVARGGRQHRPHQNKLVNRLHYLFFDLLPDGIELATGFISLLFTLAIGVTGKGPTADALHVFAVVCFFAGLSKIAGVILEWRWLRMLGLLGGIFFWIVFGGFLIWTTKGGGVTWPVFSVLTILQVWAFWRNVRP